MKCPECAQILTGDACGCGWAMFPNKAAEPKTKAHAAYIASGERSDSAKVNAYVANIKQKNRVRCVFLAGEGWEDYQAAKHKAMQEGMNPEAFDKLRMKLNGWIEQGDEAI
jgi:hypothetical protein